MADNAFIYNIDFTDPSKPRFVIQPGTEDNTTSLVLAGNGKLRWGENFNEALIHIMENFASPEDSGNPGNPQTSLVPNPIEGQLWFNNTDNSLNVYATSGSPAGWTSLATVDSISDSFYTKIESDARYVEVAGDTMTGDLTMSGAVVTGLPAAPSADEEATSKKYVDDQITAATGGGAIVPTGTVLSYAGSSAPSGYVLCNGQALDTTTQAALFAVIGYTYGGGGASFNVPDMRGNIPLGKDNMGGSSRNRVTNATADVLGGELGTENHTLSSAEMPVHTHTGSTGTAGSHTHTGSTSSAGNHRHWTSGGALASNTGASGDSKRVKDQAGYTDYAGTHSHTMALDSAGSHTHTMALNNAGSGQPHNNMPPTMVLNYIIKT